MGLIWRLKFLHLVEGIWDSTVASLGPRKTQQQQQQQAIIGPFFWWLSPLDSFLREEFDEHYGCS